MLIRVIYLIIIGARRSLTPKPQRTMNENHGICVEAYMEIKAAAVALKTGAPQAQMNGKV